jgi:hypothetical protein
VSHTRKEMAFIRVSSQIINLDQIAHIEVMESNNRVEISLNKIEIHFAGVAGTLPLHGEEAELVLNAVGAKDLLKAHRRSLDSFDELLNANT